MTLVQSRNIRFAVVSFLATFFLSLSPTVGNVSQLEPASILKVRSEAAAPFPTSPADLPTPIDDDFYENRGKLEPADTTLRFINGAYWMTRARYQATLRSKLGEASSIEYRSQYHRLAFTPTGLLWSRPSGESTTIREGVEQVSGRLVENGREVDGSDAPDLAGDGILYENAYGEGLHLGCLAEERRFRKIVRFDELSRLGPIPEAAEVLEVEFEMETGEETYFRATFGGEAPRLWDRRQTVVSRGEPVEFGEGNQRSFILPAHAWDSNGERTALILEFKAVGDRRFLTKRIPVAWLKKATFPVYADVDITFGTEQNFNSATSSYVSTTTLDATHVVIAYRDEADLNKGKAIVGLVSGSGISFPSPAVVFNTPDTTFISATALDSTRVLIAYTDAVAGHGQAIVGSVAGTVITFPSAEAEFETVNVPVDYVSTATLDSSRVVVAWEDGAGAGQGQSRVASIAGTAVAFPSPTATFQGLSSDWISAAALDSSRVLIAYARGGGTNGYARVGSIAGTTISFPSPEAPFEPDDRTSHISATALDGNRALISFSHNDLVTGQAIAAHVAGTTVTFVLGKVTTFNPAATSFISTSRLSSTEVVIAYQDGGNSSFGTALVAHVDCADITYGTETVFNNSGATSYIGATALNANDVVIGYQDSTTFGAAIVGQGDGSVPAPPPTIVKRMVGFETGPTATDALEVVSLGAGASIQSATVRAGSGVYALQQAASYTVFATGLAQDDMAMRFSFRKPANPASNQTLLQLVNYTFITPSGTWTWNGTTTVSSTDTSGVSIGDFIGINANGPFFEISAITPNTNVTILNPQSLPIPSGTGIRKRITTLLWHLQLTTSGRLQVQQDEAMGLTTTTGATALANNTWYTVRVGYDRAPTCGPLRVWLDTSLEINVTHTTQGSVIDEIRLFGDATPYYYDDFYLASGARGCAFGQIVRLAPNGPGNLTQFDTSVPIAATPHWQNVDEVIPDDTDLNRHSASAGATDLYALEDFALAGTIRAVKGMWRMERFAGGGGGPDEIVWRENGSTSQQAFTGLTTTFTTNSKIWTSPPQSGGPWDVTKLNGLELGASHANGFARDTDVSWIAAMVDYDNGPTEVTLTDFSAAGYDGQVAIEWRTASELNNLGFHLYRSTSAGGPYERITVQAIPGLGSSPVGGHYAYRDIEVTNGVTYYYELEDIETTGKTKRHGPVSATPEAGAAPTEECTCSRPEAGSLITYGNPSLSSLRVLERERDHVLVELTTEGFYAAPREDGSVRIEIPDFETPAEGSSPAIPMRRTWVEAIAGRNVRLVAIQAQDVERITGLRPADTDVVEIVADPNGTVRLARSRSSMGRARVRGESLYPSQAARVVSVGFQGDVKKALLELAPLRWDASTGELLLARRLVVRLSFVGREPAERSTDGVRGRRYPRRASQGVRRGLVARLATAENGLYSVRYQDVFGGRRGISSSRLRLSRQGKTATYHLEPYPDSFGPGSTLFFLGDGERANPYGHEAVYELEVGAPGALMATIAAAPAGEPVNDYWHELRLEENRLYQAGLLNAPDLWLWDLVFAPATKSFPFTVDELRSSSRPSHLTVWLQGASDLPPSPDHHVRVYVNGVLVEELSWDGKQPQSVEADLLPGLLQEGENRLEIENVGDSGADYSMVMLDRFSLRYPRLPIAISGRLEGAWSEAGIAEVSGLGAGAKLLDVSGARPRWLSGAQTGPDGALRFRTESGSSYLTVSPEAILRPEVRRMRALDLKSSRNRADYLLIGPRELLPAATPLLELRRSQGLRVKAVPVEDVYSDFGYGEATPEAIQDFVSYAYHSWGSPSPRYVLLVGDATYDFKDYLGTGAKNRVPPLMVKTTYLWTASDPSYAAVNGEDLLPDVAIGRLPAATREELQAIVAKIVSYETGEASLWGAPVVFVADNPDRAGDFVADANELASSLFSNRNVRKIYLSELGTSATRSSILQAFNEGASLASYVGHGGIHLWADENVFNTNDVASLTPQSQMPLLLTLNCLNGYFHFPYFNSLAEELLKAKDRGAVAAFSPSGLSLNEPAHRYHGALLNELFSGRHQRLGDAFLAAQGVYAETGAMPELLSIYHLLGDPALTLH